MKRKRKNIKYKKERVILSDVLPYEIPVTFSNRHLYEFLLEHKVHYRKDNIYWQQGTPALDTVIHLLFGTRKDAVIEQHTVKSFQKDTVINSYKKNKKNPPVEYASIPFCYRISHKQHEYRELAICHPRNQLQMINFYDENKELILYFCRNSPFSIRRPSKIAKFVFHKDKTHYRNLEKGAVSIEESEKEYENLRSFFVYADYSNIYRFYESYKFHRCEKKYEKLLKLDISKCFMSIYTHSLAWALLGKEKVKNQLTIDFQSVGGTFAGNFDRLMQKLNYNETNGIVIGPEFSRIFAELILQSVDQKIHDVLQENKYGFYHKRDYEIHRYVDDYFIFYNKEEVKEAIVQCLRLNLQEHKLYLNEAKATPYEKPIITNITIAKQRIAFLLDDKLAYKITETEVEVVEEETKSFKKEKRGTIKVNSNTLITQFKTIIKECDVDYKDLLNYSLSIVERKSIKIIKDYQAIVKNKGSEKNITKAILETLDFTFFIYSVCPRANTTIKLCRVLRVFSSFFKGKGVNQDFKHLVFKSIFDNLFFILKKNRSSEYTQVETLYLLIALSELGKEYWLDIKTLCLYFDIEIENTGSFKQRQLLNYFSLVVLLFYIKDKKRYGGLRAFVEQIILKKFSDNKAVLHKDTEMTLLLFDVLACPYIQSSIKKDVLTIYEVDSALHDSVINMRKSWFTKWTGFDFGKELDAKQSQDVY